jgi:hypothetical protein
MSNVEQFRNAVTDAGAQGVGAADYSDAGRLNYKRGPSEG